MLIEEELESVIIEHEYELEYYSLTLDSVLAWCQSKYSELFFTQPIVKAYWFDSSKNLAGITLVALSQSTEVLMMEVLFMGPAVQVWRPSRDEEGNPEPVQYDLRLLVQSDFDILYKKN